MKLSVQSKAFAVLLTAGLFAGCSSTGETVDEGAYDSDVAAIDQDGGSTVYGGGDQDGVSSSAMTEEERMAAERQAEQAALRDITTFYFDFDTAEIKPEARDVLVAHAQFLANNPGQQVRLEGHADERGTKEYNLALGERRANAIQRFLIVNGASRGQMETVSYGEEKPAVMGSSESTWAQNRRVELVFE
ncbi:peptidoglycan-associated lipoprotein Pal [Marinobacter qingdaonensis]|jgi:peptidoglycan-associated lipoprotein|uniref:Peptidoglycan-associated lipoprotein n=1 Tax=Marinobacter qingdaonensis TaxID=3108486 RepID=A0ABU5P154_9GAMM|nr:peptidoglycan-associated lipoprotein Pal [Marinobacter sp. ASW11-75]MCS5562783.1 peptidoglycan-associated lipoprotein Pal [Oleiphilaceae bacterium]MEA1081793.1 peptidoglycan-associated lipoprotein Pal [Marinobacter sp. ASW11-75]MEE3118324.1 peptidoglycan-associated lipoprotein Pal [Pseudomonadota bacterium]